MIPLIVALDFGHSRNAAAIAAPGDREWRAYRRALVLPHLDGEVVPSFWRDDAPLWGPVALGETLVKKIYDQQA